MPDLEQRVSVLEREASALKARVATTDEDVRNLPDLIKTEARFTNTQIARLSQVLSELHDLPAKVDAMPRAIAELVAELLAERDRKA
jgi:phosphopantothenate synthetase